MPVATKTLPERKLTKKAKRTKLANSAREYLRVKGFPVDDVLKRSIRDVPHRLAEAIQSPTFMDARQRKLREFAVLYAKFLVFKSKRLAPGIATTCEQYQNLKRAHEHAGLIACLVGIKPGNYSKSRDKINKLRIAFNTCAGSFESPQVVASGKSKHGSSWTALVDSHSLNKTPLQMNRHQMKAGKYSFALLLNTKANRVKVVGLVEVKSSKPLQKWQELQSLLK